MGDKFVKFTQKIRRMTCTSLLYSIYSVFYRSTTMSLVQLTKTLLCLQPEISGVNIAKKTVVRQLGLIFCYKPKFVGKINKYCSIVDVDLYLIEITLLYFINVSYTVLLQL